ncbi:Uncharacterised protein [Mycobacteroides abscessus subsp. abscessus]|nr:Uncharacterised protein [Mycobacteroides abscessus subsp. abscessus]
MLVPLVQGRRVAQTDLLSVDDRAGESLRLQVGEEVDELPLAQAHDGGEDEELRPLRQFEELIDDLLRGLLRDDLTADRAVRHPDAGPEQAEEVIDLGDRAHRRTGVARGRLLVDRHGRGQALDEVDVGLVHLAEEHPGVRGQGLDVAALPLGEDRVEGERRLPRSGESGEDDHGVARERDLDVLEVVRAGTLDPQRVEMGHAGGRLSRTVRFHHPSTVLLGTDTRLLTVADVTRRSRHGSRRSRRPRRSAGRCRRCRRWRPRPPRRRWPNPGCPRDRRGSDAPPRQSNRERCR